MVVTEVKPLIKKWGEYMHNIIFDLGGVLLKSKPISILKKIDINEEEYSQLINFFENWKKLDLGQQSLEEKFLECNFPDYISSKYKDILLKYYEIRDINMDLINLINKLKNNNYKTYILSDNNLEASNYYKNNALFSEIDGWVVSCDYNVTKNDGKLFEILLDNYKLKPEECYFIDDKQSNIDMAFKYNINGYKYNENSNIMKLYDDMRENDIKI